MLREKLDNLISGDQSRSAIKKEATKKKGLSAQKKRNRKYRALSGEVKDDSESASSESEARSSIEPNDKLE